MPDVIKAGTEKGATVPEGEQAKVELSRATFVLQNGKSINNLADDVRNAVETLAKDGKSVTMDKFEQQPTTPDTRLEKVEEVESQQEQLRESSIRKIAGAKQTTDSSIEGKTRAVQNILGSLEIKSLEGQEVHAEKETPNPEDTLNKIRDEFSRLENPSIDDISRALLTSGLEIRDIQIWLSRNQGEVQSLGSTKENLERRSSELSGQLSEEERKNFFAKLFRGKERRALTEQLRDSSQQAAQISAALEERGVRSSQIEAVMREISDRRQELAINAAEQLFQEVVRGNDQLRENLTAPEVKQELNESLIAQRIIPELERLQTEGRITKEDAEEYVGLLKMQLAEGRVSDWNDPIEKKEAIDARRKRIDELNAKSQHSLRDVGYRVSTESSNEAADNYYDKIFDFLVREATRERVEQLRDTLGGSLNPKLQARLGEITKGIINPYSDWRTPREQRREVLDLSKIPIDDFKRLDGLERWQIVKDFAESSGVIPKEVFVRVEKVIVQRLFDEQLFPGGRESWDGTAAAGKMGDLGNPEALPLMLRHIEASGSGHTNNAVVYAMERLLKESNPAELQQVLESLPRSKRILLETLADENSYMSRFGSYYTCHLLQNGDLTVAREQLTKILEGGGKLDEEKLRNFYLGHAEDAPATLEPLLRTRAEVERVIIESKLGIWTQSADKLLAALVNPRNGESVAFPKRIVQEGLGVSDEKMLAVLDKIFEAKTFKGSGFEREAFLDGLVLLNSKENGKAVLETLLGAYRGARSDPSRMRRVFQLLATLDGFGEYDFVIPGKDAVEKANQEIADLESKYSQTLDKAERKKIKNRKETLTGEVQNLTGLKGIEDAMTQRVVEASCRRLDLPQEYRDKIENNLDELLKGGFFEIVPSLAGKYEGKNEMEVKNLLRTITAHIIEGDFKSWRYTHERSEVQLAGLTEEQKEFWKGTLEAITIDIELPEDEKGRRADELKAAQEIIRNAKEHILDSKPDFDFSKEREQILTAKVSELTERIKSATSEDEKKRLALEKRAVQAEATLINGVLEIENATPRSFTRERMLTQARELRERITELNLPLAGLDIEQIEKVFTVGDIKSVTAFESDDALTLLRVGVEPQETCQSWRNGGFNECLLAYVADSNKKVLNVADGEGRIVARSIIKLTSQRDQNDFESKTQRKTLLVEKPYSLLPNSEVYRAFVRMLLTKAQGLDASITFGKGFDEATLQMFAEEARAVGYGMNEGSLDVFIPHSLNKYEYSDTLGGKISWFDRYQQLEAVTFEKPKA